MKITHFDGSPEEFAKIAHLFGSSNAPEGVQKGAASEEAFPEEARGTDELTSEIVERGLRRRSLSSSQKKVFAVVIDAGAAGIYIGDLAKKVGVTRAQLAGVLGALGRRFANTDGWPKDAWPIHSKRDQDKRQWKFWAAPVLREVVRRGNISFS
jgi:hypothetical protein